MSGSRWYSLDLEQGGLEIPCTITFDIGSNDKLSDLEKKAEKLVKSALTTSSAKPNSTIAEGNSDNGPDLVSCYLFSQNSVAVPLPLARVKTCDSNKPHIFN